MKEVTEPMNKSQKSLNMYENPLEYGNIHNQVLQSFWAEWQSDTNTSFIDYCNEYFNVSLDSVFSLQNNYIVSILNYSTVYDWINSLYSSNHLSFDCKETLNKLFYVSSSENICLDSIEEIENEILLMNFTDDIENILVKGAMSILKQSYIYWSNETTRIAWQQIPYSQQELTIMGNCPSVDVLAMTMWLCIPGFNYVHAYDMAGFVNRLCAYLTCDQNNFHEGIIKESIVFGSYYSRRAAKELSSN